MTDQRGAGGTREPGGAIRPRVSGGAEDGRSQAELTGRRAEKRREQRPEREPMDPIKLALLVVARLAAQRHCREGEWL